MEVEIAIDLIREFEKNKKGRILLRDLRRSTELWQDYSEVKKEVRAACKKKRRQTKMNMFGKIEFALLLIKRYYFEGIQDQTINGVNIKYFG